MKDYKILKFLDIFKGLFKKIDIDYPVMRKILQVKLLLDSRREATVTQNNQKNEDEGDKNQFLRSLWVYLIFGIIMIPLVLIGDKYLFQMSMLFGLFMFFMTTTLISDFSSVLLDLRDKEILLSKPISSRTLSMAKFIHIFFYVSTITTVMVGPALIVSLFAKGLNFFLIFLLNLILINLFLIAFTGLLYLLILKFFDGEKLKDIINYVQIGLTIIITVGFQFISRVFQFIDIDKIQFINTWWSYIIPPIWFAASFEYILKGNKEIYIVIYSVMALIIPIASITIYTLLMPIFESNLQKLNEVGGVRKHKKRLSDLIAKLICKTKEEKSFYRFSTNMFRNEREFKLKVYPSLGFGLIFPFLMLFSFSIGSDFSEVRNSSAHFNIYFVSLVISTMINFLDYSGNYKGAWIYKVMPIENPESIYKGAVKAVFMNLFTPLFLIVSIVYLSIFRLRIFPDIIATYINMLLATAIIFKISNQSLPFSKAFQTGVKGGTKVMLLSFLTTIILFAAHFASTFIPLFGVYIYIVIGIILNMIVWKYFFRTKKAVG